jgi:hypothetical protein
MRDRIIYDNATKRETAVLASWVSLEIQGADGRTATVTRWVKHDTFDPGLIRVVYGPALTAPDDYDTEDLYVGRTGAVANPRGFHRWLAEFVGWEMPQLPAREGRLAPLYMEQVFPLLFVEQRRGWGGIQAQMPYFSGVSDVRRRAVEFLLDLEVGKSEVERQRLRARDAEVQASWRASVLAFNAAIEGSGLKTSGLPENFTVAWPPERPPLVLESRGDAWTPIDDVLVELNVELLALEREALPRVREIAPAAEAALNEAYDRSDALRDASAALRDEIMRDRREAASLRERIETLREDLKEHQDIVTLQRLGSTEFSQLHDDCPVCHQVLPASLLAADLTAPTSTPQETVAYIRQQLELFEAMQSDAERTMSAKRERWSRLRILSSETRAEIRMLRSTLTSSDDAISADAVARRVHVRNRIDQIRSVQDRLLEVLGVLERMADEGRRIRMALAELPEDKLSATDLAKIIALQTSFIDQLHNYDFGSFSDEQLHISRADYLPQREEFDLQADISASDSIRVIWAYLIGLLEVARTHETNHPGLLVLDEPRQQSAKEISFRALLQRAARDAVGSQIIFATSEDLDSLEVMLAGLPHALHAIDGYVLKPVID